MLEIEIAPNTVIILFKMCNKDYQGKDYGATFQYPTNFQPSVMVVGITALSLLYTHSKDEISLADWCKNCSFDDKSMKFGI